jgi:hypothetical protein
MKKTVIIGGLIVVGLFVMLYVFNNLTTKTNTAYLFTDVLAGEFEISIASTGELIPERSVDIKGPEFAPGGDMRSMNIKIQDLIPEGTLVNEGDFVATLDRTELNNNLKDANERLTTFRTSLEMKLLDTAVIRSTKHLRFTDRQKLIWIKLRGYWNNVREATPEDWLKVKQIFIIKHTG